MATPKGLLVAPQWPLGLARPERRAAAARTLLLAAGGGAVAYAAYRVYRSETLADWRAQVRRLRAALTAYAEAFGTGADTLALLASDLRAFLASDRTAVPPSLRQLARLMQSPEMASTTSSTVAALIRGVTASGVVGGGGAAFTAAAAADNGGTDGSPSTQQAGKPALDRILDALLSDRGQSLVSVVVSLGARNLVTAFCDAQHRLSASDAAAEVAARMDANAGGVMLPSPPPPQPDLTNRLLDFLASPRGQQVAVLAVTAFVTGGMRAYLDQTLDVNFYEDLFSAMARPEHLAAVKACVGVFARDVVGTYLAGPSGPAAAAAAAAAAAQQREFAEMAGAGAGAEVPRAQLRLSGSITDLLNGVAAGRGHPQVVGEAGGDGPADTGSPCGSSASGEWQRRQEQPSVVVQEEAAGAEEVTPAGSDVDSDVLAHPTAAAAAVAAGKAPCSGDSASSWAVCTPPAGAEAVRGSGATAPSLPQLRRVQEQAAAAAGAGMQRTGSGNLEWISAVGKEWLNVAQHPQGRSVMVELAATAAKEAAAGASAALADRFRIEWLLVAAFAMLVLAWMAQRMLGMLLG